MATKVKAVVLAMTALALGCTGNLDGSEGQAALDSGGVSADVDPGGADGSDGADVASPECQSAEEFVHRRLWPGVIRPNCSNCHVAPGPGAADSTFELSGKDEPEDADIDTLSRLALDGVLLKKPIGEVEHGGGVVLAPDSTGYALLQSFVQRVEDPESVCDEVGEERPLDIVLLSPQALFRKVALSLGGRRATEEEKARLEAEGEEALVPLIDALLREEGFHQRLREGYNDILLTDAALVDFDAHPAGYLDEDHYPDRMWFGSLPVDERREPTYAARLGVTRGPIELIVHVVREGKPFTEVLTADYVMMNSYAARSYGVYNPDDFDDPEDPHEFRPIHLPPDPLVDAAFPTAGILSNYYYLHRYPSTPTNKNRHRARMVYQHFLNTDVMDLTPDRADPTEVASIDNPLRNSAQCSVCHSVIDPVAGVFQNYDFIGQRNPTPEEGWYDESFAPGFEEEELPEEETYRAIPWLAEQIADDPRFVQAAVAHAYQILFARPPLEEPIDVSAPDFDAKVRAYERQQAMLAEAGQAFVEAGMDFRVLVRHLILTEDYRANGLNEPPALGAPTEIAKSLGAAQLATPETLTRRLEAVLGQPWIYRYREPFLSMNGFRLLYGGIDSASMTRRIREPNALMGAIIQLMANDASCRIVAVELSKPAEEREFLSEISITDIPSEPGADARIRAAVANLHARFLGEYDPEEIDLTVELFEDLQREGAARIQSGEVSSALNHHCGKNAGDIREDPDFTVRAWRGVITYLLQTYEFLYE